jgi:hypothetical protein
MTTRWLVAGLVLAGCAGDATGDGREPGEPVASSDEAAQLAGYELAAEHDAKEWSCTCDAFDDTAPRMPPPAALDPTWTVTEPFAACAEYYVTAAKISEAACEQAEDAYCECRCSESTATCRTRVAKECPPGEVIEFGAAPCPG